MKVDLQELYSYIEDCAFEYGVPGVGQWVRDRINEKYNVSLDFDPEIDEEW